MNEEEDGDFQDSSHFQSSKRSSKKASSKASPESSKKKAKKEAIKEESLSDPEDREILESAESIEWQITLQERTKKPLEKAAAPPEESDVEEEMPEEEEEIVEDEEDLEVDPLEDLQSNPSGSLPKD